MSKLRNYLAAVKTTKEKININVWEAFYED